MLDLLLPDPPSHRLLPFKQPLKQAPTDFCQAEQSLGQVPTNNNKFTYLGLGNSKEIEPNTYPSFSHPKSEGGYPHELAFFSLG